MEARRVRRTGPLLACCSHFWPCGWGQWAESIPGRHSVAPDRKAGACAQVHWGLQVVSPQVDPRGAVASRLLRACSAEYYQCVLLGRSAWAEGSRHPRPLPPHFPRRGLRPTCRRDAMGAPPSTYSSALSAACAAVRKEPKLAHWAVVQDADHADHAEILDRFESDLAVRAWLRHLPFRRHRELVAGLLQHADDFCIACRAICW